MVYIICSTHLYGKLGVGFTWIYCDTNISGYHISHEARKSYVCRTRTRTRRCYHRSLGDGHRPVTARLFFEESTACFHHKSHPPVIEILPPADSNVVKMIKAEEMYENFMKIISIIFYIITAIYCVILLVVVL